MLLLLIVASLFISASADQDGKALTEIKTTKIVQEFDETCSTTGYSMKGMIWSSCRKGKTLVKGCISPSGEKVKLNETYTSSRAEYKCLVQGGKVIMTPVACIYKDQKYAIGSIFARRRFFYTCVEKPEGVGIEAIGCTDERGEMVASGEEFRRGKFIFLCQVDGAKVKEVGAKCFDSDLGIVYTIGERYFVDGFYFECKRRGSHGVKTEAVSCADPVGNMVESGERYVQDGTVFECQKDGRSYKHAVVGCYAKDHSSGNYTQYLFGEKFYVPAKKSFGYAMECVFENGRILQRPAECIYHSTKADYYLDVGCLGYVDEETLFLCGKVDGDAVMAKTMKKHKSKSVDDYLAEKDLRLCETRVAYATVE